MIVDKLDLDSSKVYKIVSRVSLIVVGMILWHSRRFIQEAERDHVLILLTGYVFYFILIEIPLHENLHYWTARRLGFTTARDLKWGVLNRLWRVNPTRNGRGKPKHPNVMVTGKQTFKQFVCITISPILILLFFIILFSILLYFLWGKNNFYSIFILAEATILVSLFVMLGDFFYIIFAIKNRIKHKSKIRFEDKGASVTAEI
ncbi:fumarate reductase subunit C [Priestia megaterium]|uniref:hypothetical protein n=1 Tax=Priestia megaterium TaxID=1404 RepID=UPI003D1CD8E5